MNISCPECSTRFTIDETQIPPGGLQFQCSSCNAVFNANKPSPFLPPARSDSEWMIRQPTGNVYRVRELTTLQRWIVERKVGRDDEISNTGKRWERLGNIPDLVAFFQVLDAADQSAQLAALTVANTRPATAPPIPKMQSDESSAPNLAIEERREDLDRSAPPTSSATLGDHALPLDSDAPEAMWEYSSAEPAVDNDGWEMSSDLDEFDAPDFGTRRRGRGRRAFLLLLLVVLSGLAVYYYFRPNDFEKLALSVWPAQATAVGDTVWQARDLMEPDTLEAYDAASTLLDAAERDYPDALELRIARAELLLARVHHAQRHQRLEGALEQAPVGADGRDQNEENETASYLGSLSKAEQEEKLRQAALLLNTALSREPKHFAAQRSMLDLRRLEGNVDAAKEILQKVKNDPQSRDDAMLRVLEAEMHGDTDSFHSLVAEQPNRLRARLNLLTATAEKGEFDAARDIAIEILREVDHPTAKLLSARVEDLEPGISQRSKPTNEHAQLEEWLEIGERARRLGNAERALRFYERALDHAPEHVEVLTGLGYAYLDLDDVTAAMDWFRRALDQDSRFSHALFGLAEAHSRRGEKKAATEHYRRYLALGSKGPRASQAERRIAELSD